MKNKIFLGLKKYKLFFIILTLFICSLFICLPLLNEKINMLYDDGVQHICRLIGTESSIKEGGIFFPIMSKFANEFGYSWNIFYSPLTAYVPLIFRIINFTYTNCIKIFMFLVTFISGITMYLFVKKVTNNSKIALLSGIIYIFVPYRLTDMYVRNALAELTSFIFIPLIFLGVNNILNEKKKVDLYLIIGTVGLILTHLIVTMYTLIFVIIYILINYKKLKNMYVIKNIIINLLLIIMISSFFLMPLLEHKLSANYEVFKEGRMERTDVLIYYKLDFYQLFVSIDNDKMIYDIGFISIIFLCLTPFVINKFLNDKKNVNLGKEIENKKSYFKTYLLFLVFGLICLFMTLKVFPFENMPSILKMIQFTFRLLEFSGFFLSFIVAINIYKIIPEKYLNVSIVIITILFMFIDLIYVGHLKFLDNVYDENNLIPYVRVTNQTGRVHSGLASFEYLPSKAFENRKYLEDRENKVIILSGNAEISNEQKNDSHLEFNIKDINSETILELPYIYYLGYDVNLVTEDKVLNIKTSESENGFVQIKLDNINSGKIIVNYTGTLIMNISKIISLFGILIVVILFILDKFKNKKVSTKID